MKRRTRLIFIGCATLGGTLTTAAQAASATPNIRTQVRAQTAQTTSAAPRRVQAPAPKVQAPAPRVQAPIQRVTVQPGDSLSAIGARMSRTWVQLAAYNNIANPNLIYPGQVLTVPPASYVPAAVSVATPAAPPQPATTYGTSTGSSQSPPAPQTSYTSTPASSSSGVWGCIASYESGGNPSTNTGNGYYGMYQDTQSSWVAGGGLAYAPRPDLASAAAQTAVNQRIQAQQGWGAWPVTSRMCGA
jgi:LysM repeat protein